MLKKIREEVSEFIRCDEDITPENLRKLKYLDCVLREVNRMNGPADILIDRIAIKDCKVADVPIQKGTLTNYCYRASQYNTQYYDNPHEFIPERWLEDRYKEPGMVEISEMVFSFGPRTCIGKHLAWIEAKIAVIKILAKYKSAVYKGGKVIEFQAINQLRSGVVKVTPYTQ